MWDNTVGRQIDRGNRNFLLANIFLVAIVILWFGVSFRSLYNQFAGPERTDALTLRKITEPQKLFRYFFLLDKASFSPVIFEDLYVRTDRKTNREISRDVNAVYQLMPVVDRLMVVKATQPMAAHASIAGALVPLPDKVKAELLQGDPSNRLSQLIMPTMLDSQRFERGEGAFVLIIMVPLLGLALFNIKRALARREDYLQHPVCKQLQSYGQPRELAGEIENDLNLTTDKIVRGPLTVSANWVIRNGLWGPSVKKLDDLVWGYLHTNTTSVYFVPVNKVHSLRLVFQDKTVIVAPSSIKDCESMLLQIAKMAPWALYGFSQERSRTWNKTPQVVIAEVAANKAKMKDQK